RSSSVASTVWRSCETRAASAGFRGGACAEFNRPSRTGNASIWRLSGFDADFQKGRRPAAAEAAAAVAGIVVADHVEHVLARFAELRRRRRFAVERRATACLLLDRGTILVERHRARAAILRD